MNWKYKALKQDYKEYLLDDYVNNLQGGEK